MLRLTGNAGEVLQVTAQRLIRYGCTEREACALANVITLERDASDSEVETAVVNALVAAKEAVSGHATVLYLDGRRCDVQRRLEGRQ